MCCDIHVCVCVCVCIYTRSHVHNKLWHTRYYTHTHTHTHKHTVTQIALYHPGVGMYVGMHACMYVSSSMNTVMHAYTHIPICIHTDIYDTFSSWGSSSSTMLIKTNCGARAWISVLPANRGARACAWIHVCMPVCMWPRACAWMHVCMPVCVCMQARAWIPGTAEIETVKPIKISFAVTCDGILVWMRACVHVLPMNGWK